MASQDHRRRAGARARPMPMSFAWHAYVPWACGRVHALGPWMCACRSQVCVAFVCDRAVCLRAFPAHMRRIPSPPVPPLTIPTRLSQQRATGVRKVVGRAEGTGRGRSAVLGSGSAQALGHVSPVQGGREGAVGRGLKRLTPDPTVWMRACPAYMCLPPGSVPAPYRRTPVLHPMGALTARRRVRVISLRV